MAKVFIGHRGVDIGSADQLADEIRAGRDGWLDAWELDIGDSRSEKIDAGVTSANLLIHRVVVR